MKDSVQNPNLKLRPVVDTDLPIFFEQQLDPEANWMAAFTAKDPTDRAAFDIHWAKVLADPGITIRAIVVDGQVAGSVLCHGWGGEPSSAIGWAGNSGAGALPPRR